MDVFEASTDGRCENPCSRKPDVGCGGPEPNLSIYQILDGRFLPEDARHASLSSLSWGPLMWGPADLNIYFYDLVLFMSPFCSLSAVRMYMHAVSVEVCTVSRGCAHRSI